MKAKYISYICIISVLMQLFVFDIPVKAGIPIPGYSELKQMQEDIENGDNRTLQDIWKVGQPIGQAIGVIMIPFLSIEAIRDLIDPVFENDSNYPANGSDQEKANYVTSYLNQNITINDDDSYTLNQNAKNIINGLINQYKSYNPIMYSFDLQKSFPTWGSDIEKLNEIISEYPDYYSFCVFYQGYLHCEFVKKTSNLYLVNANRHDMYTICQLYQGKTSNGISSVDFYTAQSSDDYFHFKYIEGEWIQESVTYPYILNGLFFEVSDTPNVGCNSPLDNWAKFFSRSSYGLKYFGSYAELESYVINIGVGKSSYYINNTVNTNYNNSSGPYTVNTDNSNKVTYGDVNTYIDDHHTENNVYPSPQDINIFIESQLISPTPIPTPIPTGSPSGGSGSVVNNNNPSISNNPTFNNNPNINITLFPSVSNNNINGGTVSGNGNGSGSGGFFGWISDIGSVIGDFIKNVGELIADVVKGITETITTILADIPNIISVLVEFVYGGLPDELKAIVTLGITTVIFVGVIKIMRK